MSCHSRPLSSSQPFKKYSLVLFQSFKKERERERAYGLIIIHSHEYQNLRNLTYLRTYAYQLCVTKPLLQFTRYLDSRISRYYNRAHTQTFRGQIQGWRRETIQH